VEPTPLFCPRCLRPLPPQLDAPFCPRCGLADAPTAAADNSPLDLVSAGRTFRVSDRLAVGSFCTLYLCRFLAAGREVTGVLKLARDPQSNARLANEAAVLRHLHAATDAARFTPFLPAVEASFDLEAESPPRRANVLRLDDTIRSPADLYTLDDVRQAYPQGLDPRDLAWIWRRLLNVLGFAHAHNVVHRAVLPPHILIEPHEHKLVLIGWSSAATTTTIPGHAPDLITGGYRDWYRRSGAARNPNAPSLDLALATRTAIELLGGDPLRAEFPPSPDPALGRYFARCLGVDGAGTPTHPWQLLEDFDRLIEALWGPRTFREFKLPPRPSTKAR
jgi:serine/threonine protein kinase